MGAYACQQRQQFGHVCIMLFAGCTFAIELFLGWNVAFVATHNLRKRVVLRRRKIFWFYFWHGSFIFDFISTCVFIAQVKLHALLSAQKHVGQLLLQLHMCP